MSSLSSNAPPTPAATAAVAKSRGSVAKLVVPRNGWYVAYAFDPESSSGCVGVHISARGYPDMTCGWCGRGFSGLWKSLSLMKHDSYPERIAVCERCEEGLVPF